MAKLVIGRNYHTTWQNNKFMIFVLKELYRDKALLVTKTTGKRFWTKRSNLIATDANYNLNKRIIKL